MDCLATHPQKKTGEEVLGGFGGSLPGGSEIFSESEMRDQGTDKTPQKPGEEVLGGFGGSLPGGSEKLEPDELPNMPLDDFAQAGLVATVWSELLGRDVLFVSDDVPEDAIREMEGTVYRARELRKLQSIELSARHLGTVDAVKRIFGGQIVEDDRVEF